MISQKDIENIKPNWPEFPIIHVEYLLLGVQDLKKQILF